MHGQIGGTWEGVGDWLVRNEALANEYSLYLLVIGYFVVMVAKFTVWDVIRYQRDMTPVGRALKRQKFSEGIAFFFQTLLYAIAAAAINIDDLPINIWTRTAIRCLLVAALLFAAFWNARLVAALKGENWGRPERRGDGLP